MTVGFTNFQRSKAVTYQSAVEPQINLMSIFDLSHCTRNLVGISDKLKIILVESGSRKLVSSTDVDVRTLLLNDGKPTLVELTGVNANSGSIVGLVDIQVSFHEKEGKSNNGNNNNNNNKENEADRGITTSPEKLIKEVVLTEIEVERRRVLDKNRLFSAFSQKFSDEFYQIDEKFKNRPLEVLALDENNILKCVCNFLPIVDVSRSISSPRLLARFVSCLCDSQKPNDKSSFDKPNSNYWSNPLTSIVSKACNLQIKACLLAGFLQHSFKDPPI